MNTFDTGLWVSTREAAELLGVPRGTIRLAVERGRMAAVKRSGYWYVRRADVVAFRGIERRKPGRKGSR